MGVKEGASVPAHPPSPPPLDKPVQGNNPRVTVIEKNGFAGHFLDKAEKKMIGVRYHGNGVRE